MSRRQYRQYGKAKSTMEGMKWKWNHASILPIAGNLPGALRLGGCFPLISGCLQKTED
ncbi:MAG: hypothetical protein LBL72_09745 [Candidatus Accumulibacter sp.]|nr:hypothetical protein [Accumulibacter sp.]